MNTMWFLHGRVLAGYYFIYGAKRGEVTFEWFDIQKLLCEVKIKTALNQKSEMTK